MANKTKPRKKKPSRPAAWVKELRELKQIHEEGLEKIVEQKRALAAQDAVQRNLALFAGALLLDKDNEARQAIIGDYTQELSEEALDELELNLYTYVIHRPSVIKEANVSFRQLYDFITRQHDTIARLLENKDKSKPDMLELRATTVESYQAFEPVLNIVLSFQENTDTFMSELSKCLGEDWTKWAREQLRAIANSDKNKVEDLNERENAWRKAILPRWKEKETSLHQRMLAELDAVMKEVSEEEVSQEEKGEEI